ncbi:SDR family oxidoreductase [Variovorax sp. RCC_210]|uniref:SDR family oxidoreductase n=1 Tax=Variovorax sp. RCC_210 TaxID=3239217 RepID=UPI00352580A3
MPPSPSGWRVDARWQSVDAAAETLRAAAPGGARAARIVIVGAAGFLGHALAEAFARRGVRLVCTARDLSSARERAAWPQQRTRWLRADLEEVPPVSFWMPHLLPGDVVINAAGVLREHAPGEFDAVHHRGPTMLFEACEKAGAALVIQISALGAHARAASEYHRSKARADDRLRRCHVASAIVQPSLVWDEDGASAQFFAALAVMPLLALPGGGRQLLQPVHLDDVVAGVLALADARPPGSRTIAFVGPRAVMLRTYLLDLRRQLGHRRRPLLLPMPEAAFRRAAGVAGRWRHSFLDADTAGMLLQGNAAPADDFTRWLGRPPRPHEHFVDAGRAEALRRAAWLWSLLPALRVAVALVWIWTFIVSIGLYPRDQSLALLARVGAGGAWAELLLDGAALLDLALGIGTLALPARWRARLLWPLQLALIAFYTLAISWAMPEFWLHPFGPLSKNLPMCAAIALLWAMDAPGVGRTPGRAALRRAERNPWNTSS